MFDFLQDLRKAAGAPNMTALPIEEAIGPGDVALAVGVRAFIDSVNSNNWMSPNQPMLPTAPVGTLPRTFDYPFGSNLYFTPRQEQPGGPDFTQLRNLARYDIVRLCIETRKAQILEMPQLWRVRREPGEKNQDYKKRNEKDDRIAFLNDFFRNPDREHSWLDWLNMIVEEILVTDALSIWPVLDEKAKLISLRVLDGATIKPLHDTQGWRPAPPNPAFQQVIKGSPAVMLTAGICDKCIGGFKDPNHRCMPLIYKPFNPTVNKFYGWSPTEQVLYTIMIGMNRMVSQLSLYTEGNLPEMLASLPEKWDLAQIKQYQAWFDQLAGDVSIKRRVRFIPEVKTLLQTKDPMIKDDRDDWLARICCYAFSVAPNPLVKQMNRASSQSLVSSAIEEGKLPLLNRLSEMLTYVVNTYMGEDFDDIEHAFNTEIQSDPQKQATINDVKLKNGSRSIDETRDDDGLEPLPGGIGAKYMIYQPSGPILVEDAGKPPEPPLGMPGMPGAPGAPPFGGAQPKAALPGGKLRDNPFEKPKVKGNANVSPKQIAAPEESPAGKKEAKKLLKLLPVHEDPPTRIY